MLICIANAAIFIKDKGWIFIKHAECELCGCQTMVRLDEFIGQGLGLSGPPTVRQLSKNYASVAIILNDVIDGRHSK